MKGGRVSSRTEFREILFSQFISVGGGLLAGTILAIWTDKILLIPGMLILLPGFLGLRGNISGSMAARLGSGLFLRFIKPGKIKKNRIVRGNVTASFLLAIIVSLAIGLMAFIFTLVFFGVSYPKIILIPLFAGIISNIIEIPLALFFTIYLFKKGHDPDNIMGPFVSTVGDIVSILSLLIVILII